MLLLAREAFLIVGERQTVGDRRLAEWSCSDLIGSFHLFSFHLEELINKLRSCSQDRKCTT